MCHTRVWLWRITAYCLSNPPHPTFPRVPIGITSLARTGKKVPHCTTLEWNFRKAKWQNALQPETKSAMSIGPPLTTRTPKGGSRDRRRTWPRVARDRDPGRFLVVSLRKTGEKAAGSGPVSSSASLGSLEFRIEAFAGFNSAVAACNDLLGSHDLSVVRLARAPALSRWRYPRCTAVSSVAMTTARRRAARSEGSLLGHERLLRGSTATAKDQLTRSRTGSRINLQQSQHGSLEGCT